MTTSARILIVDDHVLFAEAVAMALRARGYTVAGVVGTIEEAMPAVERSQPELVLVDIALTDGNGVGLGRAILREHPEIRVVAVSALNDSRTVREALQAGLNGYIIKDTPLGRFVQAIETVLAGDVVVPRALSRHVAGMRTSEEEAVALLIAQLTRREQQVLGLLVEGASSKQIARVLGIRPNTVRTHVQNILAKLQVGSRLEAAAFAVRHGIGGRSGGVASGPRSKMH